MRYQMQLTEEGQPLLLVHFIYRGPKGVVRLEGASMAVAEDTWRIACVPNLTQLHDKDRWQQPWQRSSDVRAVTCPACRGAAQFQAAKAELDAVLARQRSRRGRRR